MQPRYALLSVSDKRALVPLAKALAAADFTLLSTGGTLAALAAAGLSVTAVSDHTGAPELMDGRVKTLHPRIHAGLLGDRTRHAAEAKAHEIPWIDVVVCNLYPFEATVRAGAAPSEVLEQIDIGGPTMLRAAAKNHPSVTVVCDPSDYDLLIGALPGGASPELRATLAAKAFAHTARYDSLIAAWMAQPVEAADKGHLPTFTNVALERLSLLRYGENPHQRAAFYGRRGEGGRSLADAVLHQGKALSFNNLADLDGAVRCVFEHDDPAVAVIKHMNPAGCATSASLVQAFELALAGDPVSAFGGIVAFNRPVTGDVVRALRGARTFFECVVAPGFSAEALERLAGRTKLRVLELPADWAERRPDGFDARRVQGGWLLQDWDVGAPLGWEVASQRAPSGSEVATLGMAWRCVRAVRSNAIVLARGHHSGASLVGVGAGQMSRVDAVHLAVRKAGSAVAGTVLASDAFFPFADGIEAAAAAGVTAVIQPGGSIRDAEVIAAANAAGLAVVFTGTRHFRH